MVKAVHGILIRIVAGLLFAAVLTLATSETGFAGQHSGIARISADFERHTGHSEHSDCDHAQAATCAAPAILAGQSFYLAGPAAPATLKNSGDTEHADGLRAPPLRRPPRILS